MVETEHLELRLPVEADRSRFVELFGDEHFMTFSGGVLDRTSANERFDGMLRRAGQVPFAKQPVIDRLSGRILGYVGVDTAELDGVERFEFGYRLEPAARGRGFATEASLAVLDIVDARHTGDILALIDPTNEPSRNVAGKLGFVFWKQAVVNGYLDDIHVRRCGPGVVR